MLEKIPTHDLKRFKEESKDAPYVLYQKTKKRVRRYRYAFVFIGFFFLLLAWILWTHSTFWITLYFKPFVIAFSIVLGFSSLAIATFLKYETESARALYTQTVRKLKQIYKIRQAKSYKDLHLPIPELLRSKISLRAHFVQTKSKLKKIESETIDLMEKIRHTDLPEPDKVKLYNQALMELRDHFEPVVKKYQEK